MIRGHFASLTDKGKVRVSNDDQACVCRNENGDVLLVVCDGMGGYRKGDYASKMAIGILVDSFRRKNKILLPRSWFSSCLRAINKEIFDKAESDPGYKGMGTTLVSVLIRKNRLYIVNIGDSRAYAYQVGKGLLRLTEDQTLVDYLVHTGKINQEEVGARADRHVLMNALGIYPSPSYSFRKREYKEEAILLCSDGLYNNLSDPEIRQVLSCDGRPDQKVQNLVIDANANGGSDNIGLAYWEPLHD